MSIEQGILSTPSNNGSTIQVSNILNNSADSNLCRIDINGTLNLNNGCIIFGNETANELALLSSPSWKGGSGLVLRNENASASGSFWLKAHDVKNDIENGLFGKANKSLSWCGYLISQLSMPSNKYIDLEIGSSGTWYKAPANGYFFVSAHATAISDWISMYSSIGILGTNSKAVTANDGLSLYLPITKNDSVVLNYRSNAVIEHVKFIYSVLDSIITE